MSRYNTEICPYCERPSATEEVSEEWQQRYDACEEDDNDPGLKAWDVQYCWYRLFSSDLCISSAEDRLIQVLEQRDALAAQLAILS